MDQAPSLNLFSYATSELSQDAFLAWFIAHADPRNMSTVTNSAQKFIEKCIRTKFSDFNCCDILSVEIRKQYQSIDLLVIINDEYYIIIEDKTATGPHDNQLRRYRQSLEKDSRKLVLIYYKTGNESLSVTRRIVKEGYSVISRSDFLSLWSPDEIGNQPSEILRDYTEHIRKIETRTNRFLQLPFEKWNWLAVEGFYMMLEKHIPSSERPGWKYVPNQNGGFKEFLWHWKRNDEVCMYLRLNDGILNINIGELAKGLDYSAIRNKYYRLCLKVAKSLNLSIEKPARFGYGKYMTVAVVPAEKIYGKTRIDFDNVVSILRSYEQLIDQVLELASRHD